LTDNSSYRKILKEAKKMTVSMIKTILHSDIRIVWNTVLDVNHYAAWRSDLSRTETVNEKQFIEYTNSGYPTTFTVTAVEPLKRWEFDMENSNIHGHWVGTFASRGNDTEVTFTETVTCKKWIMKPFVKGYLRKQQAQFISDLENALRR